MDTEDEEQPKRFDFWGRLKRRKLSHMDFEGGGTQYPRRKRPNPAKFVAIIYFSVMFLGGCILWLPISHVQGGSVSFIDALFTSISGVSVTGLATVPTNTTWSLFGRIVLAILIQIGALGPMSLVATFFFFMKKKKMHYGTRVNIQYAFSLPGKSGIMRVMKHMLIGALLFETVGAILLATRYAAEFGFWGGLGMGVFHSITAFGNAGFDLFGGTPYSMTGVERFGDGTVLNIIMILSILGGLGFFVWEDVWESKFIFKKLQLHSKLVLTTTFWLILVGTALFFFSEIRNPKTIGLMTLPQAMHTSLFQAMVPRSTGFSILNNGALRGSTKMIVIMLMLIGGSSGSTAGGIKNVTFAVLMLSSLNYFKGNKTVTVWKRTIPSTQLKNAFDITMLIVGTTMLGTFIISLVQPEFAFSAILFECVSAIGNVGSSYGITTHMTSISKIVLMSLMFFGRIGIMTLGLATFVGHKKDERLKHVESWIMIG